MTIPTSRSPSTTGRQPIFLATSTLAASSTAASGVMVMGRSLISSLTAAPARPGESRTPRRSRSERMPTSRPLSITGRWRIRRSRISSQARRAPSCGLTVIRSVDITSRTESAMTSLLPEQSRDLFG